MNLLLLTITAVVQVTAADWPNMLDVKVDIGGGAASAGIKNGKFEAQLGPMKFGSSSTAADSDRTAANLWQSDDVASWLKNMGDGFKPYAEKVIEEGVTAEMLMNLTEAELQEDLGVTKKLHKKRIMTEREKLRGLTVSEAEVADRQLQTTFNKVANPLVKAAKHEDFTGGEVAASMWLGLQDKGVEIDQHWQHVADDLERVFESFTRNALGYEALEWLLHELISITFCSSNEPCIGDEQKRFLPLVMDAKSAVKKGFHNIRSGIGKVVSAIASFRLVLGGSDLTTSLEHEEKDLLKNVFNAWAGEVSKILTDLKNISDRLYERAKSQISSPGGGEAVKTTYARVVELSSMIERLAMKRNDILKNGANGVSAADLKFAIESKKGNVSARTASLYRDIDRIEMELKQLQAVRIEKNDFSLKALHRIFSLNDKKQEHVDWLYSWKNLFKAKIDDYSSDVDRNIQAYKQVGGEAKEAAQMLDEAAKELEKKLGHLRQELEVLETITDKRMHDWYFTTSGIWDVERDMLELVHQKAKAQDILRSAMQTANLPDPIASARILTKAQELLMLISSVVSDTKDILEQVDGWKANFDNLISRLNGKAHADSRFLLAMLPIVEKSFKTIVDAYSRHMDQITTGDNKSVMIDSCVKKLLPNPGAESPSRRTEL